MFNKKIIKINYIAYLFFYFKEFWDMFSLPNYYKSWFLSTLKEINEDKVLNCYLIALSRSVTPKKFKENYELSRVIEIKSFFKNSLKREVIKNLLKRGVWV